MPNPVQLAFRSSVPAPAAARDDNSGGDSFPEIMQSLGANSPKAREVDQSSQKAGSYEEPASAVSTHKAGHKDTPRSKDAISDEQAPGTESPGSQSTDTVAPRRQRHGKLRAGGSGSESEQLQKNSAASSTLVGDAGPIVVPVQANPEPTAAPTSAVSQSTSESSQDPLDLTEATRSGAFHSVEATTPTSGANVSGTSAATPTSAPTSGQPPLPAVPATEQFKDDSVQPDTVTSPTAGRVKLPKIRNDNRTAHAAASSATQTQREQISTGHSGAPRSATTAGLQQNFAMARLAYASMSQPGNRNIAIPDQATVQFASGVRAPLGIPQAPTAGNLDPSNQAFQMPPEFAASAQIEIEQTSAVKESAVVVEFSASDMASGAETPANVPVGNAVTSTIRGQQHAQGVTPQQKRHADVDPESKTLPTASATSNDSSTPILSANDVLAETDTSRRFKVESQQVRAQAGAEVPRTNLGAAKQKDRVNSVVPSAIPSSQDRKADDDIIAGTTVPGQGTREVPASDSIASGQSTQKTEKEMPVNASVAASTIASSAAQSNTQNVANSKDLPTGPKRADRIETSSPRVSEARNARENEVQNAPDKPAQQADSAPQPPQSSQRVSDVPQASAHVTSLHPAQSVATSQSVSQPSGTVEHAQAGGTTGPDAAGASSTAHTSPQTERAYTLVETARLVERASATEMRVGVHTPELGKVEVHASLRDNTLGASLSVERPEIQRMFASELPNLNRALDRHQVELQSVSLMDSSMQQAGSQGRQDQQQAPQKQLWPQTSESSASPTESRPASTRALEVRSSQWVGSGLDLLA